jgi:hypothetical protein
MRKQFKLQSNSSLMKFKSLFTMFLATAAVTASAQTIVGTVSTNKNVVLEELTGKTCGYCPDGHRIGNLIYTNNPGRVILLNIHTGGYASGTPNYRTGWGDNVGSLYSVSGYPTGAVNRTDFGAGVMHSRGSWTTNSSTTLAQSSPVNIAANAAVDLDTRLMTVDVEAYYTADGTGTSNRVHVVVTQDNVPGPQSGASFNPTAILPNGDYNHMHMVRYAMTPNAGDAISSVTATSLYSNQYTHTFPAAINGIAVNIADLKTVAYVSGAAATAAIETGAEATMSFTASTPLGISNQAATVNASLGTVCGTSADVEMQVTNMGNTALATATFEYVVNNGTPVTYQHTFSSALATGQYETITVPVAGLSPNGAASSIDVSVTLLNGTANPNTNATNGLSATTATMQSASTTTATVNLTTDNYGSETSWELVNETTGTTLASGSGYGNNETITPVTATLVDGNCYKFIIEDSYGDGICCTYGNGSFSFTAGSTTFSSGGQFLSEDGIKFTFDQLTGVSILGESTDAINVMPNPVSNNMTLEFTVAEMADLNITILNGLGQTIKQIANGSFDGTNVIDVRTADLSSGVYFVNITSAKGTSTKRFIVKK